MTYGDALLSTSGSLTLSSCGLSEAQEAKGRGLIVSLGVATGAVGGSLVGSRLGSLPLGLLLHLAGDRMPHEDIPDRRFEIGSGIAGVLLLAAVRGPFDPAVSGALGASSPDIEHVLRLPQPGGRKLFPSHRIHGWHRSGGVSVAAQLVLAGFSSACFFIGVRAAKRLGPGAS